MYLPVPLLRSALGLRDRFRERLGLEGLWSRGELMPYSALNCVYGYPTGETGVSAKETVFCKFPGPGALGILLRSREDRWSWGRKTAIWKNRTGYLSVS